ncbi:MAG: hypothetical protein GTN89_11345 [Acidobacteria bacterium]|nr:hypothetical protein [Acidobacteriota bacterium]NIM62346.1 hypothetical protein [Acidobacteriota bacterium]NIO59857.1 hypothetical protein [Acidobacteriota bacterium]NIQ30942.1 hypothetical protein [Acidobacteriota bacterium]NIQ86018.1 hypothetical protein [Acidobacteriota bacterium]
MNDARRLWIIDPSQKNPEDQGVEEIRQGWSGESRLFRPSLEGDGPRPDDGYACDAVVLMGSAASVYEELGWLADLRQWLRPIVAGETRLPLLGICFGHQLVAEMAGARVDWLEASRAKRVGVEQTEVRGSRLLPEDADLRVVVSHRETVVDVPEGYRVTARRAGVPFDGLEHEALDIFSYQFHPEARDEFAARNGIDVTAIDATLRADSRRLLDGFRRVCAAG